MMPDGVPSGVPEVYSKLSPGASTGSSPTTPGPRTSFMTPIASVMRQWRRRSCPRGCQGGGIHLAEMAGDVMPRPHLAHRRLLAPAAIERIGAARVKTAPRRRIDRARHVALEDDAVALGLGIGQRHRREQRLGIGVKRIGEERF